MRQEAPAPCRCKKIIASDPGLSQGRTGVVCFKEGYAITQKEVNEIIGAQIELCAATLQRKTGEYAGGCSDRLGSFKSAAALQHGTPSQALAGMLAKHIVSLYDMCFANNVKYDLCTWEEKITDSINYLLLLKAIVKEEDEHRQN